MLHLLHWLAPLETRQIKRLVLQNSRHLVSNLGVADVVDQINWLITLVVLKVLVGALENEFFDDLYAACLLVALQKHMQGRVTVRVLYVHF